MHGEFWTKELLGYYMDTKPSKIITKGIKDPINGLYKMDTSTSHDSLYLFEGISTSGFWHQQMGHMHFQQLHTLSIDGMFMVLSTPQICGDYQLGKQCKSNIPKQNTQSASSMNEFIHADLCGPLPHGSLSRSKYFIVFIDYYSCKSWTYFMKTKSEGFEKFKFFKRCVKFKTNIRIKTLRSDKGGEFLSNEFSFFCEEYGI